MLFMVLIAIVLIGALTAAIMSAGDGENSNISAEDLAIKVSEAQRQAAEYERAVLFILQNGISEADLRFAHPEESADYGDLAADTTPENQVFAPKGGAATYRPPPADINDGSAWEFYGATAIPGIGSAKADLVAVLPHVTAQFCARVNALNGQTAPQDTGTTPPSGPAPGNCVHIGSLGRFSDARQFYASPNTMDQTTFMQDATISAAKPAPQACVVCELDSERYFYHVLLAR